MVLNVSKPSACLRYLQISMLIGSTYTGLSIYFFYGLPNSYRELKRQRAGWQKLKYSDRL